MKKSYSKPAVYIERLSQSSAIMTCGSSVTGPVEGIPGGPTLAVEKLGCDIDVIKDDFCYNLPVPGSNYFTS